MLRIRVYFGKRVPGRYVVTYTYRGVTHQYGKRHTTIDRAAAFANELVDNLGCSAAYVIDSVKALRLEDAVVWSVRAAAKPKLRSQNGKRLYRRRCPRPSHQNTPAGLAE